MSLKNQINICLSSDNNYAQHLAVTIASILKNKGVNDEFSFLILDGDIAEEHKDKISSLKSIHDFDIEFVKVDNKLFEKCPIQDWTHLSIVTYYRLVLPNIKPEWDKIIYLDCDIVVRDSLADLFNLDISDNYFASVIDISAQKHAGRLGLKTYCNAGVMLIDAKKWRQDNITKKLFEWIEANNEKIVLHDQDILNAALENNIEYLDEKWNTLYLTRSLDKNKEKWSSAKIIHYIDKKKPWLWYSPDVFAKEYRSCLKLTPYKTYLKKFYLTKLPKSLVIKALQFFFLTENIDESTKMIKICGLKFYKKRNKKA